MSLSKNHNATELVKRIRQYQKESKCSLIYLSAKSGLHRNTLNRLHDADFNPTASTIDAVIKYMESMS